jgi:hypothetical protein
MANLSLRGLDSATLARIRSSARRLKVSVNRLIVETLRRHYAPGPRPRDQIDELAGTWSAQEAREFKEAIKPFSEVDPALWAAEPQAAYRVHAARKRGRGRRRA